jgi:hypothetical protein
LEEGWRGIGSLERRLYLQTSAGIIREKGWSVCYEDVGRGGKKFRKMEWVRRKERRKEKRNQEDFRGDPEKRRNRRMDGARSKEGSRGLSRVPAEKRDQED